MAWTLNPDKSYTHAGTGRDVYVAGAALAQPGALWIRFDQPASNVKGVLLSDGGFNCVEAGIEGANVIVRTVTNGTPSASVLGSAAHGLTAGVPVTMRVDLENTIVKVFFNGVLPAAITVDLANDPTATAMLARSGCGFLSEVNGAVVFEAYTAPLIPNVLPSIKVLVWVVNGDIWYATRDPSTGAVRAALAKSRALSASQPISTAEFQQQLFLCDGVGGHRIFDAATLSVRDWVRSGVTAPFYAIAAHQARVFGVTTTDKQNLLASAVNDPTDYDTGSQIPGSAYGLSESNMPKIGEPIRSLFPSTTGTLIVFCARSVWANSGDPALGGFSVTPVAFGIGGSGLRCATLMTDGRVACHTTDGLCVIAGTTLTRVSIETLTDIIQINRPLDDYTVSVLRDSSLHGLLIFLTPVSTAISGPAVHIWYDERTGKYLPSNGGFWPESYPEVIGPTASCDWDGTAVLGGRDGCLRTYDTQQANYDGIAIAWSLPVLLAAPDDLEQDTILTELSVTRADTATEFDVVLYGGRSAEEAMIGAGRTLLARKRTYARTSKFMPNVRSPAIVAVLSGSAYNTTCALEAVQVVTTYGELSRFARKPATDTAFGNSLLRGSSQNLGGTGGSGGSGGGGIGGITGTGSGTGGRPGGGFGTGITGTGSGAGGRPGGGLGAGEITAPPYPTAPAGEGSRGSGGFETEGN